MKGKNKMNNIVKYSPASLFSNKDEFLTPFSTFFDDFFNDSFEETQFGLDFFGKSAYPKVDVIDNENDIQIIAEVPGLTKEQVQVEIDNGILRIKGEKQESIDDKSKKYVHRELKKSSFCRSFEVGDNINKEGVDAVFKDGILTITLKKLTPTPKVEPKKIEIK